MSEFAVVTGASRGIGRATALSFARRGVGLALLGRASTARDEVVAACRGLAVAVRAYDCDLAEPDETRRACESLLADFGAPRAVVNNAALLVRGPLLHELSLDDWDRTMAVNLRGPFVVCRALLPAMLATGRGRFIHVSSISGTMGSPRAAAYGASKWALIGLSKSLAEELRDTGLQSVAILPGSVDTDMLALTPFKADMTPAHVAQVIGYYAFDAPDAIQGATVELFG